MSDTSQGPGWWLASDGKWYPPELWTGPPSSGPAPVRWQAQTQPGYSPQPSYPVTPTQGPGAEGYGYGYGYSPYGANPAHPYSQVAQRKTNGLAIAALVCGCGGFLLFVPAFLGIIFGFVARTQIKRSNGAQKGDGMAIAGIIVGFAWLAILVLSIAIGHSNNDNNGVVGSVLLMGQMGLSGSH